MSEPQPQSQAMGSNPPHASRSRAFRFLESIALNVSAKENSVLRKLLSLRTEKQRLIERRKKVKAAMKDKYMQLESLEQQIDNLDIEISRLMSLRENESDD